MTQWHQTLLQTDAKDFSTLCFAKLHGCFFPDQFQKDILVSVVLDPIEVRLKFEMTGAPSLFKFGCML